MIKKVCCTCNKYKKPKCKDKDVFTKRKTTCDKWEQK